MWQWIIEHKEQLIPWIGWALSEIMALVPAVKLKAGGVIELVLQLLGYKGETPQLPKPPTQ